jgi:putative ABC transport system permease protein
MITLLAINHNVERAVAGSFNRREVDLVITQAGKSSDLNSDFGEELVRQTRELPGVVKPGGVSEAVVDLLPLRRENGTIQEPAIMVHGWRLDNSAFADMQLVSGQFLKENDTGKVMLGSTLARNINKGPGDTILLGVDAKYEVIGVFKSFVVFEDGGVVMLLKDAQDLTGKRITGFSVKVAKTAPPGTPEAAAEVERVKQAIEAMRDPEDPSARLAARSPESYVSSVTHLQIVRALTWMVGVVALAIGIISMLNTMVMSVLERTQEIGILRAVGWPRSRVIRMVLGEAVMLGLFAAVVGTVGAFAATHLLVMSPRVAGFIEPGVAPVVIAQGLGVTALIGLLGGAYPAIRAARLLPTEAIRHD